MEIKEIRVGQIVLTQHDTETLYKVTEVKGGKATVKKLELDDNPIMASISNLTLLVNS